jgi:hypothetical protein
VRLEKERLTAEGHSDVSSASEFDSAATDDEELPKPGGTIHDTSTLNSYANRF